MKNKMFINENNGMIEIFFTPDELNSVINLLNFTSSICSELVKNQGGALTPEMINNFNAKKILASVMSEKLVLDADPGRPAGDLN